MDRQADLTACRDALSRSRETPCPYTYTVTGDPAYVAGHRLETIRRMRSATEPNKIDLAEAKEIVDEALELAKTAEVHDLTLLENLSAEQVLKLLLPYDKEIAYALRIYRIKDEF